MFFFFKQKTAYEMRISDWSSDVCSSDLEAEFAIAGAATSDDTIRPAIRNFRRISNIPFEKEFGHRYNCHCDHARKLSRERMGAAKKHALCCDCSNLFLNNPRSEDHTSELQSLNRISYSVFCLKRNNNKNKY